VGSLGARGEPFLDDLRRRAEEEVDPEVSDLLAEVVEALGASANRPRDGAPTADAG
jgi:hypothetical protein